MGTRDDDSGGSTPDEAFRADPAGLRAVAHQFAGLGDDAAAAMTYASTWVDFDPTGGAAIERLNDWCTGMDDGVRDLMADIHQAVSGTAAAIFASADRYEDLDAAAAQRLDSNYWKH
ncbi:type VII secretion target [Phycicoccus avicenniae]|uniref:type VII secretion target n=1 Tax=Phycicoccus avicenniae TaxID=2828860 RepID=UPI003D284A72